jgi:hypothetical protein
LITLKATQVVVNFPLKTTERGKSITKVPKLRLPCASKWRNPHNKGYYNNKPQVGGQDNPQPQPNGQCKSQ